MVGMPLRNNFSVQRRQTLWRPDIRPAARPVATSHLPRGDTGVKQGLQRPFAGGQAGEERGVVSSKAGKREGLAASITR